MVFWMRVLKAMGGALVNWFVLKTDTIPDHNRIDKLLRLALKEELSEPRVTRRNPNAEAVSLGAQVERVCDAMFPTYLDYVRGNASGRSLLVSSVAQSLSSDAIWPKNVYAKFCALFKAVHGKLALDLVHRSKGRTRKFVPWDTINHWRRIVHGNRSWTNDETEGTDRFLDAIKRSPSVFMEYLKNSGEESASPVVNFQVAPMVRFSATMWPTETVGMCSWEDFCRRIKDDGADVYVSSVQTDGFYVNVTFAGSTVKTLSKFGGWRKRRKVDPEDKRPKVCCELGMDPGRGRDIVTCTDTRFNINKSQYYMATGKTFVEKEHNKWAAAAGVNQATQLLARNSVKVLDADTFVDRMSASWRGYMALLAAYSGRKYADVRYYAHTREQSFWDEYCHRMKREYGDGVSVAFGAANFAVNSKGCKSAPKKRVRQQLEAHGIRVVLVNEMRSSKCCLKCALFHGVAAEKKLAVIGTHVRNDDGDYVVEKRESWHVTKCTHCGQYYQRDRSAAFTILFLQHCDSKFGRRPWVFTPGTWWSRLPKAASTRDECEFLEKCQPLYHRLDAKVNIYDM